MFFSRRKSDENPKQGNCYCNVLLKEYWLHWPVKAVPPRNWRPSPPKSRQRCRTKWMRILGQIISQQQLRERTAENQFWNQDQPINQSINQSINWSINQSINGDNQSNDRTINQSINRDLTTVVWIETGFRTFRNFDDKAFHSKTRNFERMRFVFRTSSPVGVKRQQASKAVALSSLYTFHQSAPCSRAGTFRIATLLRAFYRFLAA